jgi:hypothetical protein
MIRMVLILCVGVVLGMAVGTALAGPEVGAVGTLLGAAFAMLWIASERSTRPLPAGGPVGRESHRLLCVATGQFAEVELAHDGQHWCDVSSCSLCRPADQVGCRKRCLDLMNDNHRPAPRDS